MSIRILIPLDCSASAERVLAYLHWVGSPESTELILVGVVEAWRYSYGMPDYRMADMLTSVQASTKEYLDYQVAELREVGYAVSSKVVEGDPADMILALAKELDVEMIAMTTHGRSGFVRWALGSVAERVLHDSSVPVFLVRDFDPHPVKDGLQILVPLDGSKLSEQALQSAIQVAQRCHGRLLLVHALNLPTNMGLQFLLESQEEVDELVEQWWHDAEAYLLATADAVRMLGVEVKTQLIHGEPDKVIDDLAKKGEVGIIAMSTHGRTGLQRWVYGSIASKVLRSVECPLLLVRAKADGGDGKLFSLEGVESQKEAAA